MSDRSGCSLVELSVLEVLGTGTAGRPRAHVRSAKALTAIDERIGLGPRYAYELLLDLARPWIVPARTVAVTGNYGDRGFPPPAEPEHTGCRPSHCGWVVLDAEARRLAPIPVGLINGNAYRGSIQPPLDPFGVLAALRRLLENPRLSDDELVRIVGPPWSGTGCSVTGDSAALARGHRTVFRESGQIAMTGVPVREKPSDAPPAPDHGELHYLSAGVGEALPAHLVIESLPARTVASEVAQAIARRAAAPSWPDPDSGLPRRAALPVAQVDDRSAGGKVRILLTLRPGADPADVRSQLAAIRGISAETVYAFPAPLARLLRAWVNDHCGEDITASLTVLENAIRADQRSGGRSR